MAQIKEIRTREHGSLIYHTELVAKEQSPVILMDEGGNQLLTLPGGPAPCDFTDQLRPIAMADIGSLRRDRRLFLRVPAGIVIDDASTTGDI